MPNKMLIDATHPEETRVVVLRGNRVEEFDFESANRKQLRGNIYLAKVTRVEPSLQAAFVDYGGNRHGFLAFSEIHPDYYQIPVADRQALIDEEERAARAADAEADNRAGRRAQRERSARNPRDAVRSEPVESDDSDFEVAAMAAACEVMAPEAGTPEKPEAAEKAEETAAVSRDPETPPAVAQEQLAELEATGAAPAENQAPDAAPQLPAEADREVASTSPAASPSETSPHDDASSPDASPHHAEAATDAHDRPAEDASGAAEHEGTADGENVTEVNGNGHGSEEEIIESVGGSDAMEEVPERAPRLRRQYKIQEVIKRRQVMLVQVVKEERGTKGAALTTYLSLAGRYSVLMPNTARGGGISRKITDAQDRRRLKEMVQELEVPEGMGVILRTAGASRTKTEIKRDFEYLLRLWETVRDLTLRSTAPTLVYEEGSLIKRSIRDLYNKDIDEILVGGEAGYHEAKDFMRMLMPSHTKNVKLFRDTLPIFTRFGIESQLDAMFQPVVQLRSGGYIVLNQTEALVAIDVNSGRATREHHIEDTALKTNLEAADEIARQLRLRDLAGLIVIDFIDMDEKRNNRTVERRLKEALKHDRARIQVGHISHFGLLEMSRQRIRSSVLESSTEKCPHCGGSGHVRSVSSVALQLLRALEEMLLKGATHNLVVRTRTEIALYLLNHKRAHLRTLEERFQIAIVINADASIGGQLSYVIEKGEQVHSVEQAKAIAAQAPSIPAVADDEDEEEAYDDDEAVGAVDEAQAAEHEGAPSEGEGRGRKRRRRRRGRRGGEGRETREDAGAATDQPAPAMADAEEPGEEEEGEAFDESAAPAEAGGSGEHEDHGDHGEHGERRRRRRGRRGGRRNRRNREGEASSHPSEAEPAAATDAVAASVDVETTSRTEYRQEDVGPHEPHEAHATLEREAAPVEEEPAPTPAPAAAPAEAEVAQPEGPRRRSTVREPAAAVGHERPEPHQTEPVAYEHVRALEPSSQPVVTSTSDTEGDDRPRRSGWWSRKVFGKS